MCGIAGIVSRTSKSPRNGAERIQRMLDLLEHRGPDGRGYLQSMNQQCLLGNTRLAIVDVDSRFPVPFQVPNSHSALTFNGEIFNYRELMTVLKRQGYIFNSQSDTEVLYHFLRDSGTSELAKLDGFWCFAFFDERDHSVTLSRDLLGEKHLFFIIDEEELIFASEPQAVIAACLRRLDFDPKGIASSWLYGSAPPGETLISGLQRLLPGQKLIMSRSGEIRSSIALKLTPEKHLDFFHAAPSLNEVTDLYRQTIGNSCAARIPMEVDFFATLSGGIDSTLVTTFSAERSSSSIQTIHGLFSDLSPARGADLSERDAARRTSELFSTRHLEADLLHSDWADDVAQIASSSFTGNTDPGVLSFRLISKTVHQRGAKVVLFSDGPDELLGGYIPDAAQYQRAQVNSPIFHLASRGLNSTPILQRIGDQLGLKLPPHPFDRSGKEFMPIHQRWLPVGAERIFGKQMVQNILGVYGRYPESYMDVFEELDFGQKTALIYANQSLPDHFNLRSDLGAMAYSVESRLPLQSPDLVNLMIATPSKYRFDIPIKNTLGDSTVGTKTLLRFMLNKTTGPEIASRQKYGFSQNLMFLKSDENRSEFAQFMEETTHDASFLDILDLSIPRVLDYDFGWFLYCIEMTSRQLTSLNNEFID